MAVNVETLEKLERKITLTLPVNVIQSEVDSRLKRLARTVKMDGFRPGKVPMNVVAQRYGYSVHYEVMNDKVGEAFASAANEAKLRVAGQPRITEKEGAPEGELAFDAVFEVYPEVKIGDLAAAEVERVSTEVTDAAIDKTLDILRKQRRTFQQRAAAERLRLSQVEVFEVASFYHHFEIVDDAAFEQFMGLRDGHFPIAVLTSEQRNMIGSTSQLVVVPMKIMLKQQGMLGRPGHPDLITPDYRRLRDLIAEADCIIQQGDIRLVFVLARDAASKNRWWKAIVRQDVGETNPAIVSYQPADDREIRREARKGTIILDKRA